MNLADQFRTELAKAFEGDPAALELEVLGKDALLRLMEKDTDGALFLDSLARVVPVLAQGVMTALEEIDALKAAIEPGD